MSNVIEAKEVFSEIVNNKKQLILKISQTNDFVYPNERYKYQIYCKNVSGDTIENVQIQVYNPPEISIDEDESLPPQGVEIGDLNNGESRLLYLPARCSSVGKYTVHFLCFGEESALVSKKIEITCNYDANEDKTIHRIHIYNFTPYEEKYQLLSKDYNTDVTQLVKRQKLPFGARENPFKMVSEDLSNNTIVDESQNYIDQKRILYDNQYDSDEHNYQYLERENFNKEGIETFEGTTLKEIFDDINKKSKFFKATFLKNGTNALQNDFKQYNPDGFLYRFGLMNSEIFHYIGVLPDYSYMNDYLFRWAAEGKLPFNLYPKRLDMNWGANKWAGRGWNVWKTYTDEYKAQIIDSENYKPLYQFIETFENLETAKQYIQKEYAYDTSNEFYIHTEQGLTKIRKYKYYIKESYFDTGVFFINIPLSKIPSNFISLTTEEIESIIEKTKPYGMKALIRYVIDAKFNIDLNTKHYVKLYPKTSLELSDVNRINHAVLPYQYHNVIETICYNKNGTTTYKERKALKLVPSGNASYNSALFDIEPKINILDTEPTSASNIGLDTSFSENAYKCQNNLTLTNLVKISDLLYQGNFDDISFYIKNITTLKMIGSTEDISFSKISSTNYKLWKDCLFYNNTKNIDSHSHWWDITLLDEGNQSNYYLSDAINNQNLSEISGKIDFLEIPLTNKELIQPGVEIGIGFEDISGKLHGISSEYYEKLNNFKVKYATSLNNNFKIQKEGISDLTGLAYKFINIGNNTLVIFFIRKQVSNKNEYHYFDHIVTGKLKSVFCFVRNDKDITSIKKWSNLIRIGRNIAAKVMFNTPQYDNIKSYDPNIIIKQDSTQWQNIHRIDKDQQSYSIIQNSSRDEMEVDDILLHFDNIDIPNDAIIKEISLNTTVESNSYKSIYPSIRIQDGFITENSSVMSLDLYPSNIECYPYFNNNTAYYEEQYNQAKINNIEKSIKLFESKIIENTLFDESLELSLDYLNNIDEYITIKKPFWIELSDFSDYSISLNQIKEITFCIEGYNKGKEIYLISQLKKNETYSERNKIRIPTGYFKKYIPLKFYNKFTLDDLQLRFRFIDLNADLYIYDTYIETEFNKKQIEQISFEYQDEVDITNKKNIDLKLVANEIPSYITKNGLTVKLEFDNLEIGEYYRIYDMQLDICYQKQNINFIVNSNSKQISSNSNDFTIINGITSNNLESGMFYNEIIMPGTYQPKSISNSENQGIELTDALYQSFVATTDNMTSITLYPNGFVGNPDSNLKIALYENKGNTPNKLIKEIRVNGWSKKNKDLKNANIITYDFNINHLKIGEKYWIKISVDNVLKNNYYLLKYSDTTKNGLKLLTRIDNNFVNTYGMLKFHINTINDYKSFNSLPASEDSLDFSDPKISLSINKRAGEIQQIKIQKKS